MEGVQGTGWLPVCPGLNQLTTVGVRTLPSLASYPDAQVTWATDAGATSMTSGTTPCSVNCFAMIESVCSVPVNFEEKKKHVKSDEK